MVSVVVLAATGHGVGAFVAGLLLGVGIGYLLGPALRSWLIYREWAEASRRARLTDKVLARMEEDARRNPHPRLAAPRQRKSG